MRAIELAKVEGIGAYDYPRGVKVLKGEKQNYAEVWGFGWYRQNEGGAVKHRIKITPAQAITLIRIIEDGYNPYQNMPHNALITAENYIHHDINQRL